MAADCKPVQIGLAGLGNVGAGVYQNLEKNGNLLRERTGKEVVIRQVVVRNLERQRPVQVPAEMLSTRLEDLVEDDEIDVVVELIGGIDEAFALVSEALKRGKVVITANKALLAERGQALFKLAEENQTSIYFEAAVAGGIPIIKTVQESLVGNRIESMIGIINGTSNYILTRMTDAGLSYAEALQEAQDLGYAEADPTLDVNGGDAAHKAVILASLSYGSWVPFEEIHIEGIEYVRREDIQFAEELGYALKLIAVIRLGEGDSIECRVQPSLIPDSHILASVNGVFNAIAVKGDIVGETLFYGSGAGQDPTSSSVISDIADAAITQGNIHRRTGFVPHGLYGKPLDIEDTVSQYYLRLVVEDQPGVLSQISGILGKFDVGILSMIQHEAANVESGAPIVLMLHDARFGTVKEAVAEISALNCVSTTPVLMRVEHPG